MSVLFDNIKPGDTVHYKTPQGQMGKGKVVMNRGTHLVLNAGGRYGRPQVVTDKNYVKHSRDGKVVGALLSRLSVQEGSWDKEQAERNDPNYQWNPSKGPAPILKKLPKGTPIAYKDPEKGWVGQSKAYYKAVEKARKGLKEAAKLRVPRVTELPNNTPTKKTPEQQGLIPSPAAMRAKAEKARLAGNKLSPYKLGEPQMNAAKAFGWVKEEVRSPSDAEYATAKKFMKSKKNADDLQLGGLGVHTKTGNIHVHLITKSGSGSGSHHVISPDGKELREDYMNTEPHKWNYPDKPEGVLKLGKEQKAAMRKSAKVHDALLKKLHGKRSVKEDSKDAEGAAERVAKTKKHKKKLHEVSKELAKRYVIAAVKDINHSSREAEGARTAAYADYMNKKAVKRSNAIAKNTKALRAYKDHVFGKDIYKEETVNELSTGKLVKYVSRAIADRKKAGHEFQIASKDQYAATPSQDKAFARIDKRSKGITKALGKIASNLPAEPLKAHADSESSKHGGWSGMNEVSAPGKEAWIKANKQRFIARYGKEKGLRVLYAKAWKDTKNESVNEGKVPEVYSLYGLKHTPDGMKSKGTADFEFTKHFTSAEKAQKFAENHHGKPLKWKHENGVTHARSGKNFGSSHYHISKLDIHEARESEWQANMQLAGRVTKTDPGHYLVRDGRRLSGPHSPEDAVREYKKMGDSKGVKIVHVKETHHFDVTRELIFEAEDKYKKAIDKAINLKKKAKGNKHVDTEPKLDMVDKGTNSPMEDSGDQNVAKL